MSSQKQGGGLIIFATFLCGIVLSQMPLPDFVGWARPEWVAMILIYWVMALPHSVGVGSGFVAGIVLDVIRGSVLGANALALAIVAYFASILYRRMRVFPIWQQSLLVMVIVGIHQLILHWVQMVVGFTGDSLLFLLPSLVSAVFWPFIFLFLRRVRRTFYVS
ncbi:rod shape-determining protein MreD [Pontibacterium sp.]|uniref:rod shape-determining protein MreD n=1 Tax=Pontibacterium sp. TaxID=2036026 RepID=UPI0035162F8F